MVDKTEEKKSDYYDDAKMLLQYSKNRSISVEKAFEEIGKLQGGWLTQDQMEKINRLKKTGLTEVESKDGSNRFGFKFGKDNIDISFNPQRTDTLKLSINGQEKSFFDLKNSEFFAIASFFPPHSEERFQNADLSERLLSVDMNKTPPTKEEKIEFLQGLLNKGYTAAGVTLMNYYKKEELAQREQGKTDDALDALRQFDEVSKKVDDQQQKAEDGFKKMPFKDTFDRNTAKNGSFSLGLKDIAGLIKDGHTDKKVTDLMKSTEKGRNSFMRSLLYIGAPVFCAAAFGITATTLAVGGVAALGLYFMAEKEKAFTGENKNNFILGMKSAGKQISRETKGVLKEATKLMKDTIGEENINKMKNILNGGR